MTTDPNTFHWISPWEIHQQNYLIHNVCFSFHIEHTLVHIHIDPGMRMNEQAITMLIRVLKCHSHVGYFYWGCPPSILCSMPINWRSSQDKWLTNDHCQPLHYEHSSIKIIAYMKCPLLNYMQIIRFSSYFMPRFGEHKSYWDNDI